MRDQLRAAISTDGLLSVTVTPKASRARIETGAGGIRVYVTVAPEKGKANKAVCALVAKTLGVAKSRVAIHSGATSRQKILRVEE